METPAPEHSRLEGIVEYSAAIDTVIQKADRRIRVFDRDLDHLGFNAPQRCEALRSFLRVRPTNRLQIVVHEVEHIVRFCPRLRELLRQFSHAISIQQTHAHARGAYDPFVIADSAHFVHRFHFDDSRSLLALDDPQGAHNLNDRFDELWEASFPAVFATTIGL